MQQSVLSGADGAVGEVNVREAVLFSVRFAIFCLVATQLCQPPRLRLFKERGHFLTAHPPRLGKGGEYADETPRLARVLFEEQLVQFVPRHSKSF